MTCMKSVMKEKVGVWTPMINGERVFLEISGCQTAQRMGGLTTNGGLTQIQLTHC
jgi:hypothetical protein